MAKLSKEDSVQSSLVNLARTLGPNAKLPRVAELCTRLTVSRSTLDRVLRKLKADRTLFCRRGAGIFVSPLSTQRRIGVVFDKYFYGQQEFSEFWGLLHGAILQIGQDNRDDIRTYFGYPGKDDGQQGAFALKDDLETRPLSGILTIGLLDAQAFEWLKTWNVPLISMGAGFDLSHAGVIFNEDQCITKALGALQGEGCKNIAIAYHTGEDEMFEEETDPLSLSYRKYCAGSGLSYSAANRWTRRILPPQFASKQFEEIGAQMIRQEVIAKPLNERPDGIFFHDDCMAHGGLVELLKGGIVPGRDIPIVALSNKGASILRPFNSSIIRVDIDPMEVAQALFKLLAKSLAGERVRSRLHKINPSLRLPNPPPIHSLSPAETSQVSANI